MPEPERLGEVYEEKDGAIARTTRAAYGSDLADGLPLFFSQESSHHRCGVKAHMQARDVEINRNEVSYGNLMEHVYRTDTGMFVSMALLLWYFFYRFNDQGNSTTGQSSYLKSGYHRRSYI